MSPDEHRRLVEQHLYILDPIASKLRRRLPPMVDVQDLISVGAIGLMRAAASFDPTRGVKFTTYASQRVQGAMLDWLRDMDWVPRLERQRAKVDGREIVQVGSLSKVIAEGDRRDVVSADYIAATSDAPLDVDQLDLLDGLTRGFTRAERLAFRLYWFEGMTMKSVGTAIGVHESRVSQMMANLLLRIRAAHGEERLRTMLEAA